MDDRKSAREILNLVGNENNIENVTPCFTRLRFQLRSDEPVNKELLSRVEGVISVVSANGELQVICGARVTKIYEALVEEMSGDSKSKKIAEQQTNKMSIGNRILQIITQIFTPLIPAIAAAGLIKGVLTAAKLIMQWRGIDISDSDTYMILYSASQVIFYFFPIFLAMTTAKTLKCNQVIAMMIGATLVYPAMDAMIQSVETPTRIFGLPVMKAAWQTGESIRVFSYTESVIPIILAVIVMAYLERLLKKIIPAVIQLIFVPGLELLIMLVLTLCILGPVGIYIGNGIQWIYDVVIGFSPILGGGLIGGLWGVFVIFGAHRALLPIGLNDVAINGHQNILAFAGSANFAQGGAAFGVMLKSKKADVKQIATSGVIAATLVGVTEPAIYGCNLRYKKPIVCAVIAGAIGGAIMGIGNVYGDAFANNGILTIFTYAAFGMTKFIFYLIGIAVAFFGAAVLTYIIGFEDDVTQQHISARSKDEAILASQTENQQTVNESKVLNRYQITSPMFGTAVPLSEVKDEAFASGALGQGAAIIPTKGEVVAPQDCEIMVLYPTLHAIGLRLDCGVELLIHIGINTVRLNGKYFHSFVTQGMHVKKGTILVTFDMENITKEGYDLITPIVVANTMDYPFIEAEYGAMEISHEFLHIKS